MGAMITTLTSAQEHDLRETYTKWLAIGRSMAWVDQDAARLIFAKFYAAIGEPAPRVLFFSSPAMCVLAFAAINAAKAKSKNTTNERDQLVDQLWDQLGDQLRGQLWGQLWDQLGDQLRGQLWDQLRDQLRGQLWGQLWDQLGDQLGDQLWDQLVDQLWDQLGDQLRGQLRDQLRDQLDWRRYFIGDQWCAWKVFYDFCRRIGVKYRSEDNTLLDLWMDEAQTCHWWWPYRGLVIASERPSRLCVDERGRLHAEDGPAIGYADGWVVHAWHGIRVKPHVIDAPETITAQQIKDEENAEVRRVMLARMGEDRFIQESGAQPIHKDACGVLYDFGDNTLAVKVINSTAEPDGSFKPYWLYVHPELRPLHMKENGEVEMGEPQSKTARNAVASTFGLRGDDYAPAMET